MVQKIAEYIATHPQQLAEQIAAHIGISLFALLVAALIGIPCGCLAAKLQKGEALITAPFEMLRVVPSLAVLILLMLLMGRDFLDSAESFFALLLPFLITEGPILGFCVVRTFRIFQHPESYTFCKTNLCNPKGGNIRDTIKFTVLLEDADGDKFAADTHSIFHTHRGFLAPSLEDYVNQTVTAAYNEETGMVVVIG